MEQLTIYANAKINLALDVLNRRPDGYHTVRMIMQSLSLCDTLFLQKTKLEETIKQKFREDLSFVSEKSTGTPESLQNPVWQRQEWLKY